MVDLEPRLQAALGERYVLDRELGRGGMAIVYLARDRKHDREVAIKVLRPEIGASLGSERFLLEIQTAAKLNHPHVLPLHDSGEADGLLYYVMPYVEGESLRDRIRRDGSLPAAEALQIAREVGSALHYAHERGIVHRDIKPENILLSGGHAVVADFGIARAITVSGGEGLTQTGMAVGTPAYMSPEQVVGSQDLDGRSDIYSLACVVYEMLSGEPPFEGPTAQAVMAARFSDPVPKVATLRGKLSSASTRGLTQAFAQDPGERPATAQAFVDQLGGDVGVAPSLAERVGVLGVVGLYFMGAVLVLALTRALLLLLGLPEWTMLGMGALLTLGLPIVVGAAALERRASGPPAWLTWPRVVRAGAVAAGVWAAVVSGYAAMRTLGIGPVGTLVASGVIDRGQRVLLADMHNRTSDSLLAQAVTEALRVDLAQSQIVQVLEPQYLRTVLARMQRAPNTPIDAELANEIAVREGITAVIQGEITPAGDGFVLTTRLIDPKQGTTLVALRETASGSGDVIQAIDRLSKKLRERIGESLKTLRASEPLAQVTTGSLDALQRYSQALRAIDEADVTRGRTLLQEAVQLDTAFGMAYRKLGVVAFDRVEQVAALEKAFAHRDRLTDRERYLTLGTYYSTLTQEPEKAVDAYETLLELFPADYSGLNNLAVLKSDLRRFEEASDLFQRAIAADASSPNSYIGLVSAQTAAGQIEAARATYEQFAQRFQTHPAVNTVEVTLLASIGEYETAEQSARDLLDTGRGNPTILLTAYNQLAVLALVRGRLAEGEEYVREAVRMATALGVPNVSLNGELQVGIIDAWLRGEPDRGKATVNAALREHPLASIAPLNRPYSLLAMFYVFADEPERARAVWQEFEQAVDPELRRGAEDDRHVMSGLIAIADDRPADAIREFRDADQRGCPICVLPLYGMAYDRAGNTDSTIAVFERYLSTPWFGRVGSDWFAKGPTLERLGQLYEQRGDTEKAIEYYSRFIDLWQNADPELGQRVEEARQRMLQLSPERRTP